MPISLPIINDPGQNPIVWTIDIVSLLLDAIPPTNMGIKWVAKVMKYYNIILNKNKRCYLPFHMCKYKPPST
jgi:hypothetical protein